MTRSVSGTAFVNGTDDENWPFSDETTQQSIDFSKLVDHGQGPVPLDLRPVKWGGECRVELPLTAVVIDDKGLVRIEGSAKLFEGTSEDTGDLEQEKSISFEVARTTKSNPDPTRFDISLKSSGVGGGDHAEITLVCQNNIVEEE